jgi:HSP20 family protein
VKPEDVKISVEANLLTIKGTKEQVAKEQVAEEQAEKVHRYERTYGAFERTFRLSASIDPNKIRATYNLGVLTITLPKAATAKPHQEHDHRTVQQQACRHQRDESLK